jgi:mannose-6-phosphate isomerase
MASSGQLPLPELAPFRITPRFVERVWGYQDLHPWYDRVAASGDPDPPATGPGRWGGDPIGEVWLTGDECLVATGPYTGKTLAGLFAEQPEVMLGKAASDSGSPLLIKVIFAREKLSVQVHPDDSLARKYGQPRGKSECWYVLAAEPGAQVAAGLNPGVTLDTIKEGIRAGTLEASLNLLTVAAGEMIYVDAGTVHAIWPGSILLETQQNSDLTYRLYDYGRGRELHIEKALEAVRLKTRAGKVPAMVFADRTILVDEQYFRVERIPVAGSRTSASLAREGQTAGLAYLFATAGFGSVYSPSRHFDPVDLPARGIVAIPAAAPEFVVEDLGGLDLVRIAPNWPKETPSGETPPGETK